METLTVEGDQCFASKSRFSETGWKRSQQRTQNQRTKPTEEAAHALEKEGESRAVVHGENHEVELEKPKYEATLFEDKNKNYYARQVRHFC